MVEGVDAGVDAGAAGGVAECVAGGVGRSVVLQWLPGADHPEL